jgi:hypothetical protein
MNEQIKNITIKIILTIPAIIVGILTAIAFMLKPLFLLWFPEEQIIEQAPPEDVQANHTFM